MNKKHLAAAFAVFAATTMSFSAFAASIDANARAYERAAAEQYTYAAPQAATPAYQSGYVTSAPRPGYKPLQRFLTLQVTWHNKCLYPKNWAIQSCSTSNNCCRSSNYGPYRT